MIKLLATTTIVLSTLLQFEGCNKSKKPKEDTKSNPDTKCSTSVNFGDYEAEVILTKNDDTWFVGIIDCPDGYTTVANLDLSRQVTGFNANTPHCDISGLEAQTEAKPCLKKVAVVEQEAEPIVEATPAERFAAAKENFQGVAGGDGGIEGKFKLLLAKLNTYRKQRDFLKSEISKTIEKRQHKRTSDDLKSLLRETKNKFDKAEKSLKDYKGVFQKAQNEFKEASAAVGETRIDVEAENTATGLKMYVNHLKAAIDGLPEKEAALEEVNEKKKTTLKKRITKTLKKTLLGDAQSVEKVVLEETNDVDTFYQTKIDNAEHLIKKQKTTIENRTKAVLSAILALGTETSGVSELTKDAIKKNVLSAQDALNLADLVFYYQTFSGDDLQKLKKAHKDTNFVATQFPEAFWFKQALQPSLVSLLNHEVDKLFDDRTPSGLSKTSSTVKFAGEEFLTYSRTLNLFEGAGIDELLEIVYTLRKLPFSSVHLPKPKTKEQREWMKTAKDKIDDAHKTKREEGLKAEKDLKEDLHQTAQEQARLDAAAAEQARLYADAAAAARGTT